MLFFPINWNLKPEGTDFHDRSRFICNIKLNDVWKLMFVYSRNVSDILVLTSIKIHRKTDAGEFLISGEFRRSYSSSATMHMKFARIIEAGSSFIEIYSTLNNEFYTQKDRVLGFVKIFHVCEQTLSDLNNTIDNSNQLRSLLQLSTDLIQILIPGSCHFTDITLKCGDFSSRAHKIILAARSPVFAALFANPLTHTNKVEIIDIDSWMLKSLIIYIYAGRIPNLTVYSACDLLFAADKYQVQALKTVCSSFLKKCVSSQNVWKILVLGDLLSEELKSFAMDYICNNGDDFSVLEGTQDWKDLRKVRPALAIEVLEHMVKDKDKKLKRDNNTK